MKDLKEVIAKKLEEKELGLDYQEIYNLIEIPPQDNMGDFAFPCFTLARTMRKNPKLIAEEIAKSLEIEGVEKIENENAYVNFFLDKQKVTNEVINEVLEKEDDHIGHIRSTVIGDVIRNIYEYLGYNVTASNYIGDYGTQFGVMIAAYKLWGDKEAIDKDPI
ncbi:MAG: arginine--tRNA ligase, partial [Anaerococcus hydrogenalis]|nr:arginine--tRNA ligase [Anaerococcus hydrogenalis]